jgi:ATP-binding cassette subfamily F protein uup
MAFCLTAKDLSKTFGSRTLFSGVEFSVHERERLALIGPNGSGKSTLLKLIAGLIDPDEGKVVTRKGVRAAYVAQADIFPEGATVLSAITSDLHEAMAAGRLPQFHDDYEIDLAAHLALDRAGFENLEQKCDSLSGGQRKRLAIVRELAKDPDVILLDEPTNHLDVEGIAWLEDVLRSGSFASVVVTHDRAFLESVATRIVELARSYPAGTFSVDGNYSEFLRRKQEFLDGQARQEQALAGQVRLDLKWLARGPEGRRTKSKARIEDSYQRMDELAELRARNAPVKAAAIDFSATERKTLKLIVARAITKSLGGKRLFTDVDMVLSPGECLGLMGPNGSGKSTLIKVLKGDLEPDPPTPEAIKAAAEAIGVPPSTPPPGTISRADNLRVVVFSQHRTELDPAATLGDTLSPHSDSVIYRGRPIHVNSWAQRFLFSKEQLRNPVRALSGGEQARIHIARLMLEPADVLVLDEPTNDLDIPSLEVLEESLEDFPGAILLVTHDRAMLGRLASKILALDGRGGARYFADYDQFESVRAREAKGGSVPMEPAKFAPPPTPAPPKKVKLTYKEQQELKNMEATIHKAEADARALEERLHQVVAGPDRSKARDLAQQLSEAQARIATLYARWEELEARA